ALEDAAALLVEHRFEHFAAGAVRSSVVGDQCGVGVLAALEQARAADAGDRAFAVESHEGLVAYDGTAGREQKLVEAGMRADRRHQGGDMQRASAVAGDLDMIDVGLVTDLELERRVHLVLARDRADVAFDEHRARPLLDDDEGTGEYRSGLA